MSATSPPLVPAPQELIARGKPQYLRTVILYLVLGTLLYFSLRNAPFSEIWVSLRQLTLSQIGILFLINMLVILAMTARWWIIVRAENPSIPFGPLVRYRLSVFGVSYFTPGPQVGGEPLQVFYLQRNHGMTFARATSAVIMDKLVEFLTNSIFIGGGITAAIRVGLVSRNGTQALGSLIPVAAILVIPIVHIALLHRGRYPISGILRGATSVFGNPGWARLIIVAERMAASFIRRRFSRLLASLFFSMLAMAGTAVEYFLMASYLKAALSVEQTLAALTAMLMAFLMPLPGGLGALEASQVYAFTAMGYAPAAGVSLSLLIRARDILNGSIGLLLAGRSIRGMNS